jgi:hypothetical protein
MTPSVKYAVLGTATVSTIVLALWPVLDADARAGVLMAAAVALPVQLAAFALLHRSREGLEGFLAVWIGGTLARLAVVGVAAVFVIRTQMAGAVPMLLSLAGFFFALLLLEPVCFRVGSGNTVEA